MKDDFAELAVLDAYKWWIASDFGFLQLTGVLDKNGNDGADLGQFDKEVMRRIARAYTVSRNIPSHENDAQAEALAVSLSGSELAPMLRLSFVDRARALTGFIRSNPVTLSQKGKGEEPTKKNIASAITKLTWFLQPEDWTIFDKYVGVAILRREGTGLKQMEAYYAHLADGWDLISSQLCKACADNGFNRRLGYRIVDKFLFLHGIAMYVPGQKKDGQPRTVLNKNSRLAERIESGSLTPIRQSLRSFGGALPIDLHEKLKRLGEDAALILADAHWIKDPA